MPDPKVHALIEEIKVMVRKADLGAVVIITSKTHTEFLYEVCPSWSCARLEEEDQTGAFIRVRSKRVDYPSAEAQKEHLERTFGMFMGLHNCCRNAVNILATLVKACVGTMTIEHADWVEAKKPK